MRRAAWLMVVAATCACGGGHGARVTGSAPRDGAVARRDGGSPRSGELAGLRRFWGLTPDDVWAVGERGLVVHFDGRTWHKLPSGTDADLLGMAGRERGDAWIVGHNGTILRLKGTTCSPENLLGDAGTSLVPEGTALFDVWVADAGTAWVAGGVPGDGGMAVLGRREGERWIFDHDDGKPLTAVWGRGADDVWARGDDSVVHWNGRFLIAHPREKVPNRRGRHGFAGGWRLGNDQSLTHPSRPSPPTEPGQKNARRVQDFWAFGSDDVWAATRSTLLHFDGHAWTEASLAP